MTDALNQPIVFGRTYGYSQNSNGSTTIVIGKAVKQSELTVTLEVISRKTAHREDDPKLILPGRNKTKHNSISCKGNMLFPIVEEVIISCSKEEFINNLKSLISHLRIDRSTISDISDYERLEDVEINEIANDLIRYCKE
jgi:hypothetical protein